MMEAVTNSEIFTHSLFVAQKAKDAVVDRFRDKTGRRPDVDLIHPSFRLYIHIFKNEVTLNLDSSGEPLYKRGYRSDINEAPMKEVLAAGLVKLSGWEKHLQLVDGMCGAGTIPIEAALWPITFRRVITATSLPLCAGITLTKNCTTPFTKAPSPKSPMIPLT